MNARRARLEAIILFVVATVLAVYLWSGRRDLGSAAREGREGHLLPAFDPTRIERITISDGRREPTVLERDPGGSDPHAFRLGGASAAPRSEVDRAELAGLLRTLDFATFLRTMDAADLPALAFDSSSAPLTLEVELQGTSYRVVIGGPASSPAGARYAHTTGDDGSDRAGVVARSLAEALDKTSQELRGRLLFPYGKSKTKTLVIEHPLARTTLASDRLGFLVTQAPAATKDQESPVVPAVTARRADPNRVDGLFFQLARAGMDAYPDLAGQPRQPSVVVTLTPDTGAPVRVELGGACPGHPDLVRAVRTAPDTLEGCTKSVVLDALAPRDLGSSGLWPFSADEIDHIVITGTGATLDLIRDGAGFRRLSPDPGHLELERGNDFLKELTELDLLDAPCSGSPVGKIRLVGQPSGATDTRELSLILRQASGRTLVEREDDGVCLQLTERARWLLDPTSAWYESLEILSVRPDDVMALTTSGPDLPPEQVRRIDGEFQLDGAALDQTLLDETLRALSPLRALRIAWGTPSFEPRLEVRIEARSSGPFILRVGPRVRGGYLATLAGRRTSFVVAPAVLRVLQRSLRSRAPAQWDPAAFMEFAVTARGVRYQFRRTGDEVVPMDDSPRELGPALLEAMSLLTPIAAVRAGELPPHMHRGPEELEIQAVLKPRDGDRRRLTVSFGAQLMHADQLVQLMTIDGTGPRYYVDRTAVLAVLDLL